MNVKDYLWGICNLEQTVMETEMKISKHVSAKASTEKKIAAKRTELERDIAERKKSIAQLSRLIKANSNFVFRGTVKEKRATTIACVITILLQALITAIAVACFGETNILGVAIVYTVIFGTAIALWLYLEYQTVLEFPVFQTICGIIALAILYIVIHGYFDFCSNIGINVIGANIIFTAVLVLIEILIGRHACKKAINAQRREYNNNKKWLKESEADLLKQQNDLKAKQQEFVHLDKQSKLALSKMQQDIDALNNFLVMTKKKLRDMYAQNVLHRNYQKWVAAATIYEYFDVGRCYELKGPDGAYNLYEQELLAHKILDSLAAINASIRQHGYSITESQRYIRSQLSECNRKVDQIVVNTYGFSKI